MTTKDVLALGTDVKPPVLFVGEYEQWKDRFLNFIDRLKNGENIRKSLEEGKMEKLKVKLPEVPENGVNEREEFKDLKDYTPQEREKEI